jgi:energy-coupling factor transport system ATP-binding protein
VVNLVLDNISKSLGSWKLSADGTFLPGVHLISGRVGSGKTTLSQITAGVLEPDSGRVTSAGVQSRTLSLQYPEYHITGATLAHEASSYGVEPVRALSLAGLDGQGGKDPLSLSRGELKRFHLTCLSLRTWDLLILDEPFSALDCQEKRQQCRMIERNRSGIVLVFTHEQHILPRTDYLWELDGRNLNFLGRVPEAIRHWKFPPMPLRYLLGRGIIPANLMEEDLLEAACGTRD